MGFAYDHQATPTSVMQTWLSNDDHVSQVVLEKFAAYKQDGKERQPDGKVAMNVREGTDHLESAVRLCTGNVQL